MAYKIFSDKFDYGQFSSYELLLEAYTLWDAILLYVRTLTFSLLWAVSCFTVFQMVNST